MPVLFLFYEGIHQEMKLEIVANLTKKISSFEGHTLIKKILYIFSYFDVIYINSIITCK